MAYIYTISHPFTNDIVYVGKANNFNVRKSSHLTGNPGTKVSDYIKTLKSQYLIAKIELLDECDDEDAYECETYWIHQLTAWGFSLLNYNKTHKVKPFKIKKSKSGKVYRAEIRKVKNKKWDISKFEVGYVFTIPNTKESRRVFTSNFKNYCRIYGIERYLKYEEDGLNYNVKVVDKKVLKDKPFGVTKSGIKRYKPLMNKQRLERRPKSKKFKYGFGNVEIGHELSIERQRFESFKICFNAFKKKNNLQLKISFSYSGDGSFINVKFVSESEVVNNPPLPKRQKSQRKVLTESQRLEIKNSNLTYRELAIKYDVSESTIDKIRRKSA